MGRIVIGAFAHVDAGKTTLSEAILHRCGVLSRTGRVDHEDSFLDYDPYERQKGITVYAKEARFSHGGRDYVYVDTPGHLDFAGEVRRSYEILDAAILVIDAGSPLPADTVSHFRHLKSLHIPVFLFLNKMDLVHRKIDEILKDLKDQLDPSVILSEDTMETVALNHEEILDHYLESGEVEEDMIRSDLREGRFFPLLCGCALREEGIEELLEYIDRYTQMPEPSDHFKAFIYKIDEYAHLKIFSGALRNRDVFGEYKISEIVQFSGNRTTQVKEVNGPDLCAVKGLQGLQVGTYLPSLFHEEGIELNALTYRILSDLDPGELYRKISVLNQEFPELKITLEDKVNIDLIGELQKDFIQKRIADQFSVSVTFSDPLINYRESVEEEVYGVGHYEPLRHYGEVLVELRPSETYRIKGRKEYSVLLDYLRTYRPHGLLSDSPLDQVEIEILDVHTHPKHTEGGDLIQALDRAIRQALYKGRSLLLEPYYLVSFKGDQKTINGIISELSSSRFVFDIEKDMIMAKIPKISFNSFILFLRNRFKDDFSHTVETEIYDRCHNEKEVLQRIGYDWQSDVRRPSGSIFTRNGAGTYVPPEEVEEYMHIDLRDHFAEYQPPVKHNLRSVGEEELKRVWNSLYKPRPRYIERNRETEKEESRDNVPAKELLYLIDGYNVMHAMEEISLQDLTMAREKVIDLVCDFAGYVSANCVLIFDAYLQDSSKASVSTRDNITIVYTRSKQTADMYIEAKSRELKDRYRIIVVTSDALEQLSVFSSDAFRLSSREFLARYHNMQKNMIRNKEVPNRPLQQLRELLDNE